MSASKPSSAVLWLQVWGLAAVQGAIALTWVIYNLYLLQLLTDSGFPKQLAIGLLILENFLAAVMEPLMGGFSDRVQHWIGSRLPLISVGVVLASALFISIPVTFTLGNLTKAVHWVLPSVLVTWSLAMAIFRSPTLSLLGRYALATNLPQAASILTIMGTLIGATAILANQFILSLGPIIAFFVGSLTLLGSAMVLRFVHPQSHVNSSAAVIATHHSLSLLRLGLIFGVGLGVTLGFSLMKHVFGLLPQFKAPLFFGMFVLSNVVTAIPAGTLAVRLGNQRAMLLGLVVVAGLVSLIGLVHNSIVAIGVALLLGAAFSFVANGTLPFALSMVPAARAGLGTGMYFSGGAVAISLFTVALGQSLLTTPIVTVFAAVVAFLVAGLGVAISRKLQTGT